jgi:hypothetical protein
MSFLTSIKSGSILFGDGSDGSQSVSGEINNYATLASSVGSDTETIDVENSSSLSAGEGVVIHQTQHSTSSEAGKYEINKISNINNNTITLDRPLKNSYAAGNKNSINRNSTVTQIVSSPQFKNVTLTGLTECKEWNGSNGGILFIQVNGTLDCNGQYLSAFAKGFRGGGAEPGESSNNEEGFHGESVSGWDDRLNDNGPNITGGGGADGTGSGGDSGASGGHAASGRDGEENDSFGTPNGGGSIGNPSLTKIYFGGGGGRGGDNDDRDVLDFTPINSTGSGFSGLSSSNPYPELVSNLDIPFGVDVGPGNSSFRGNSNDVVDAYGGMMKAGGIVIIAAKNINSAKAVSRGSGAFGQYNDGAAAVHGSGAGGSILVISKEGVSIDEIDVRGTGFTSNSGDGKDCGGGSPGRVRIDSESGSINNTGNVLIDGVGNPNNGTIDINTSVDLTAQPYSPAK